MFENLIKRYFKSFLFFGFKNMLACFFPAFIFLTLAISKKLEFTFIYRYDFLLIVCVAMQFFMVKSKMESRNELLVICLFHILGLAMELFKVNKGSWSYPEEAYSKFFGVPLYSGFMYASVASYMCQAWRWFNLKIEKQPKQFISIALAALIYLNFFTHHYIYDFRWILLLAVMHQHCAEFIILLP